MYLHACGKSGLEIATNTVKFTTEFFFSFATSGRVANLRPAFTVKIKGLVIGILPKTFAKINKAIKNIFCFSS